MPCLSVSPLAAAKRGAGPRGFTEGRAPQCCSATEGGQISDYLDGFRAADLVHVDHGVVPNAGHFTQEEAPEHTWRLIAEFTGI